MRVLLEAEKSGGGTVVLKGTAAGELWAVDAGPKWTPVHTLTASADMQATANVTAAPTSGQKLVITDIVISVDTAMTVTLEEETAGTDFFKFYMAANTTLQITLRSPRKLNTADKKLNCITSAAGNVALSISYYSEA